MRIDEEAANRNLSVEWRPFLLGPMFKDHGWDTSPFVIYPKKGENMWRDMERRTQKYGLPFKRPDADDPRPFPAHSVLAARIALIGLDEGWGQAFTRKVYTSQFARCGDISDPETLLSIALSCGTKSDILERELSRKTNFGSDDKLKLPSKPTSMAPQVLQWTKNCSGVMIVLKMRSTGRRKTRKIISKRYTRSRRDCGYNTILIDPSAEGHAKFGIRLNGATEQASFGTEADM